MKYILTIISTFISIALAAQSEPVVEAQDSLTMAQRIIVRRNGSSNADLSSRTAHMNLEFYTSANAWFTEGEFDEAAFKMNRVRFEIFGRLSNTLSYHFRQSYNKYSNPYSLDNIASSIEYANIKWTLSERFSIVAGKQFVSLGGYEYYVNVLRVREFSGFNSSVACYQTGISGSWNISKTQQLIFQVVNNRSGSDSDLFVYGRPYGLDASKFPLLATANWNGLFADGAVQLRYAASVGEVASGCPIWYLTAGNIYEKGPLLAYFDVMYSREGVDCQGRFSSAHGLNTPAVTARDVEYLTLIANADYRFLPKWNAYLKGVYEVSDVYRSNGVFKEGDSMVSWNAQACIEWFPISNEGGFKVFLHYLYKGYEPSYRKNMLLSDLPDQQRISLGIVYAIPVM